MNSWQIRGKTILIVVPHPDDELNIIGGILPSLVKNNKVFVVYGVNGDYYNFVATRFSEAIKAMKVFGIDKNDIYFLGYPDQSYTENAHMYTYDKKKPFLSKSGHIRTYGSKRNKEWCYLEHKKHRTYFIENLQYDLMELIDKKRPNVIFSIDLDFHPDHIMMSLSLEKVLGKIIKCDKDYRPLLLKAFAYEHSYYGKKDLFTFNNQSHFNLSKNGEILSNPYYRINDVIRLPLNKKCCSSNLLFNPFFKSISKYRSQNLMSFTESIINNDHPFFQRRIDSLLLLSDVDISASSGDPRYLNDFLLCDSSNIMHGNKKKIIYDLGIWQPSHDDVNATIKITFSNFKKISSIFFYHGLKSESHIKNIELVLKGEKNILSKKYNLSELCGYNNKISVISFNKDLIVNEIEIKILDTKIQNGFSEIEVFESSQFKDVKLIKLTLNDVFTKDFCVNEKEMQKYNMGYYITPGLHGDIIYDLSELFLYKRERNIIEMNKNTHGKIKIFLKDNLEIFDIVEINKNRVVEKWLTKLNVVTLRIGIVLEKIIKKLFIPHKKKGYNIIGTIYYLLRID